MKKKVIGVLLILLIVVVMGGCSDDANALGNGQFMDDDGGIVVVEKKGEEDEEDEEDGDPFAVYRTTEDWARDYSQYCFLKKSDGNLYSMASYVGKDPSDTGRKTNVLNEEAWSDCPCYYLYELYEAEDDNWFVISCGDIKPLLVEPGDKVVRLVSDASQTLELHKIEWYGYSTGLMMRCGRNIEIFDTTNGEYIKTGIETEDLQDFTFEAVDGQPLGDTHNMEKNRQCVVSYGGNKIKLSADCNEYSIRVDLVGSIGTTEPDYVLSARPSVDGNIEFDLSGLPAGIYYVGWNGGVIQIQ